MQSVTGRSMLQWEQPQHAGLDAGCVVFYVAGIVDGVFGCVIVDVAGVVDVDGVVDVASFVVVVVVVVVVDVVFVCVGGDSTDTDRSVLFTDVFIVPRTHVTMSYLPWS